MTPPDEAFGKPVVAIYTCNGTGLTDSPSIHLAESSRLHPSTVGTAHFHTEKSLYYVIKHCFDVKHISLHDGGLTEGIGPITMQKLDLTLNAYPLLEKELHMLIYCSRPIVVESARACRKLRLKCKKRLRQR